MLFGASGGDQRRVLLGWFNYVGGEVTLWDAFENGVQDGWGKLLFLFF